MTKPPVPGRSRAPRIGPACEYTGSQAKPGKRVAVGDPSGPEIGPTMNHKTYQEHGDMVREARGVRTRPERPGRHGV